MIVQGQQHLFLICLVWVHLTNGKNPSFLFIHIRAGYQLKYVVV